MRSLAIAGAVILLIWLPYLRFEYGRDFVERRGSQIFPADVIDGDERATWCDPTLSFATCGLKILKNACRDGGLVVSQATKIFQRALNRLYWTMRYAGDKLVWTKLWNGVNNFKMAYQQAILIALIWFGMTSGVIIRCLMLGIRQRQRVRASSVIAICLVPPWLALWLLTDAGRADRFWWLWPIQAIFSPHFLTETLPTIIRLKRSVLLCQTVMLLLVATQPRILDNITVWQREGWSGQDHERIQVSNLLAQQLQADGIVQTAIGYQVLMYGWNYSLHRHDPQYKVGADFDFYLKRNMAS